MEKIIVLSTIISSIGFLATGQLLRHTAYNGFKDMQIDSAIMILLFASLNTLVQIL